MSNNIRFVNRIFFKLILLVFLIALFIGSSIGITSYSFAKKELIESGKLDLEHIVQNAISVIDLLNDEVEKGNLTLEEAQEEARRILIGPKTGEQEGQLTDYTQSSFVYKEEGYLSGYDSNHRAILHPFTSLGEDRSDVVNSKGVETVKGLVEAAKATDREGHFYEYYWKNPGDHGERLKIAYFNSYEPWDWNFGVGAYAEEFYESLDSLKWIITILTAISIILGIVTVYLLMRKKFTLLYEASESSIAISNRDLRGQDLPEGNDEIGHLGVAFNQMQRRLRNLIEQLQHLSKALISNATELSASSEQSLASIEEVSGAMNEIATGAVNQASDIEDVNETLTILNESIAKMNNENRNIRKVTETSEQAASKGKEIVDVLKQSNEEAKSASLQIMESVGSLESQLMNITKITETINNISQQTNLLALNASIEAARAGEHGEGFAVVAEEVRKLAEQANHETLQIKEMIEGIEEETKATMDAIKRTTEISTQLDEAVNNTEKEFHEISSTVAKSGKALQLLNEEIHSVTEQSNRIMEAIQNVSAVSQQTAASAEEVTASVDEQSQVMSTVTSLAESLNELSEKLNEGINKYRL
ncbi:methyl-accepting chemotaxis protein [Pueribacillus sp. YX66]|uniref:methyl-accepting chemotaxis protein n=1 Tax=Pueribacillus sp. YX66 TaxID=3229242 RepID=UPI00358D6BD5